MKNFFLDVSWLELFGVKVQEGFSGLKDLGSFLLLNSLIAS